MELVGRIDWQDNIKVNPLNLDFTQFTKAECEHCNEKRYRRYTEIIMKDNGTLMQVGTGCVKEVMGYEPRHLGKSESEMFESLMFGMTKKHYYLTKEFLYRVINYFKENGFDSKVKYSDIYSALAEKRYGKEFETKRDYTLVNQVIEFFKTYKANNDFTSNVKALVTSETFNIKYFNFIKYAYKIYFDEMNFIPSYQSKKVTYETLEIKQIELKSKDTQYFGYRGYKQETYKYLIVDINNNVFLSSGTKELNYKAGDTITYRIKGTYESKKYGVVNKINYLKGAK